MKIDVLEYMEIMKEDNWTLFLDRDGVINERLPGKYISKIKEFKFKEGIIENLKKYSKIFSKIIIVTNQQGLSTGELLLEELESVQFFMLLKFRINNIDIDKVYACSALATDEISCRKPSPDLGLRAKVEFPDIVFSRSIMVGDSISDMGFADHFGMKKIFFLGKEEEEKQAEELDVDLRISHWDELDFVSFIASTYK